ncbi:FAD-dependent oxidoreductase [Salipiger sp. CCB-MM3]|uniref:FAD-dependent oxidoreductase n=1 Tax=Salipiger sp. CCB-MM3 TaxID=1792508 RepID=UPI0012FB195D|nr:FAD-dependent oxidoreductase [Salipiger sp. CCB-MM3]
MTRLTRRGFGAALLCGAALAPFTLPGRARALVVGGGPAGASAALALARSAPRASVVLVERDPTRLARAASPAFARPEAGPTLAELQAAGVEIMIDEVTEIDWQRAELQGFSGRSTGFDQLVIAPGIAALPEEIPGFDAAARHRLPAAWGNRREALRLSAQLAALPENGHVVLRLPASGLSHPQIALSRALTLADHLAKHRPSARLTVLDGGAAAGLAATFHALVPKGLEAHWLGPREGGMVTALSAPDGWIETTAGRLHADVVNFIPPQGAATLARASGLTGADHWCPTDAAGRSSLQPQAIILGDARQSAARSLASALTQARALHI